MVDFVVNKTVSWLELAVFNGQVVVLVEIYVNIRLLFYDMCHYLPVSKRLFFCVNYTFESNMRCHVFCFSVICKDKIDIRYAINMSCLPVQKGRNWFIFALQRMPWSACLLGWVAGSKRPPLHSRACITKNVQKLLIYGTYIKPYVCPCFWMVRICKRMMVIWR